MILLYTINKIKKMKIIIINNKNGQVRNFILFFSKKTYNR